MCVVSMITDHYRDRWTPLVPQQPQFVPIAPYPYGPGQMAPQQQIVLNPPAISAEEVAEFRKLLERAREYDKRNNEPHCELEEKKTALKAIAKALGVDISFIDEPCDTSIPNA